MALPIQIVSTASFGTVAEYWYVFYALRYMAFFVIGKFYGEGYFTQSCKVYGNFLTTAFSLQATTKKNEAYLITGGT